MKNSGIVSEKTFFKEKKNFISLLVLVLTFFPTLLIANIACCDSSTPLYGLATFYMFIFPVLWILISDILTILLIYVWVEKKYSFKGKRELILNNIIASFLPFIILYFILQLWGALEGNPYSFSMFPLSII